MDSSLPSILVLDDEPALRTMLLHALSRRGYAARAGTTIQDLLTNTEEPAGIVIVDLHLSGAADLGTLEALKKRFPTMEIIITTGRPELETTVTGMRLGVFDYVVKPFDLQDLYEILEKAAEHRRLAKELVRAREVNQLQAELLSGMGRQLHGTMGDLRGLVHKLSSSVAPALNGAGKTDWRQLEERINSLWQLVTDVVEVPKMSFGRTPGGAFPWTALLERLPRVSKDRTPAKILIVDDDAAIVRLLEVVLEREGYLIESASDGQAALDCLAANPPDLLLLDLLLPVKSGFDVLKTMSENPTMRRLPVIVFTAKYLLPEERRLLEGHAERIVQKGGAGIEQIVALLNERLGAFRELQPSSL